MLILEGCDLAGKTTFAHRLIKELNKRFGRVRFYSYASLTRPTAAWSQYWTYAKRIYNEIVQDRFHMSYSIYRNMVPNNKQPEHLEHQYANVEKALAKVGALTVVLCPSDTLVEHRYGAHAEELLSLPDVLTVNASYHATKLPHDLKLFSGADCNWPGEFELEKVIHEYAKRQKLS